MERGSGRGVVEEFGGGDFACKDLISRSSSSESWGNVCTTPPRNREFSLSRRHSPLPTSPSADFVIHQAPQKRLDANYDMSFIGLIIATNTGPGAQCQIWQSLAGPHGRRIVDFGWLCETVPGKLWSAGPAGLDLTPGF